MIQFKLKPHSIHKHRQVVELWEADQFIGQLTNEEGSIRLMTKHTVDISAMDGGPEGVAVVNLRIIHPGGN